MLNLPMNTALVLIDVQQGFFDPSWGERNNPEAEANIARLLFAWRQTGRPIVHAHHDSQAPTGCFRPGTPGNLPMAEAEPFPGEPVYHKRVNSAFIGTGLEEDLRVKGVETLVIVGLTTNHCVSTTARMAGNLNFNTFVVSDATATFARATVDGRMRPAQEVHDGALSDINEEFAAIVTTEEVLAAAGVSTAV